jgi:hypothetical protein
VNCWNGEKLGAGKKSSGFDLNSKFWKTFLVLLAMGLMFVGPTYAVLALWKVLDLDYTLSMVSGFSLFVVGLALLLFLINRKVIS